MQLLGASTAPMPEFASISILIKPDDSTDAVASFGEPFVVVSPLATVSSSCANHALTELHTFLTHVVKASKTAVSEGDEDAFAVELLQNDREVLSSPGLQVFRPSSASGLGLCYRLIPGSGPIMSTFSTLGLASHQSNSSAAKVDPSKLQSVVICVGVSGLSSLAQCSSSTEYDLSQRVNDCIAVLAKAGDKDVAATKSVLSSFLLMENEYKTSNAMVDARSAIAIPTVDNSSMAQKKARRTNVKGAGNPGAATMEMVLPMTLNPNTADVARNMMGRLTLLSVADSDTFLRKYETSGQDRKAMLDLTASAKKKKFRRRKGDARDADFDNFDYKGPKREVGESLVSQSNQATADIPETPQPTLRSSKKDSSRRDPRKKGPSVPVISASRSDAQHSASRTRKSGANLQFVDDEADEGSVSRRIQINVALNEDLSCSYKESQLSTCTVEGAIQLQIKTSARSVIPFYLLLRDPSSHIGVLQENRKYAEDNSDDLAQDNEDAHADRKFTIRLPNGDGYFPVLRYKCLPDLRPVPIRVQTRVKLDGASCRVALQISSNPNNSAGLTDLTIIMNVPDLVVGNTLVTQPPGGVWDESKSSSIWCVSELGGGEKFQLQAAFQLVDNEVTVDELSFPVMVRCQCLFSQLSDLEIEVRDVQDVAPAEMSMKIARRFRLSHREKS